MENLKVIVWIVNRVHMVKEKVIVDNVIHAHMEN